MCWQCDDPDATYDDFLDLQRRAMGRAGWTVVGVGGDGLRAPLAYTAGLTIHGVPELVVTGLQPGRAVRLLNAVAAHCRHSGALAPGETLDVWRGPTVEVVPLPHPDAHLFVALDLFGPQVRAQQLVWADDVGRFPWDRGHGDGHGGQPVLGPRVDVAPPAAPGGPDRR